MVAKPLLVLGCGPKALAIAVKAEALRACGFILPKIRIIEKHKVASHWYGKNGYTDGHQTLGTPPEKDLGFPYRSDIMFLESGIDAHAFQYSWPAFQMDIGHYAEWVDRGRRQPTHGEWAAYLNWARAKLGASVIYGDVQRIDHADGEWRIDYRSERTKSKIEGQGLVITGPGDPLPLTGQPADSPIVLDGKSFWLNTNRFDGLKDDDNIGVVGSGETAAAIVVELIHRIQKKRVWVTVINRQGAVFSRGESFEENTLFTDPLSWRELEKSDKEEFIRRTDRGVFSVHTKRIIDGAETVKHVTLEVDEVDLVDGKAVVYGRYGGMKKTYGYDYLINAMAFDSLWFRKLMPRRLANRLTDKREVENRIDDDLSVKGLTPKLHLPMLAALAQGPGFPNLSCLGLLSDRILSNYLKPSNR